MRIKASEGKRSHNGGSSQDSRPHGGSDSFAGHRIHKTTRIANQHPSGKKIGARAAIGFYNSTIRRSAQPEFPASRVSTLELLNEIRKQVRDIQCASLRRLSENSDPHVDDASSHRKHPSIAGKQIPFEIEHGFAHIPVNSLSVTSLRNSYVTRIRHQQIG